MHLIITPKSQIIFEFRETRETARAAEILQKTLVLIRDNFLCRYCGDQASTIDHVVNDGPNSFDNLVASCPSCNSGKGARPLADEAHRILVSETPNEVTIQFVFVNNMACAVYQSSSRIEPESEQESDEAS